MKKTAMVLVIFMMICSISFVAAIPKGTPIILIPVNLEEEEGPAPVIYVNFNIPMSPLSIPLVEEPLVIETLEITEPFNPFNSTFFKMSDFLI